IHGTQNYAYYHWTRQTSFPNDNEFTLTLVITSAIRLGKELIQLDFARRQICKIKFGAVAQGLKCTDSQSSDLRQAEYLLLTNTPRWLRQRTRKCLPANSHAPRR